MSSDASEEAQTRQRVDPDEYTESYYLTSCEGFDLYKESGGRELSPRLSHALKLASIKPGDRVLDVGCGRGEMIVQAALRGALAFGIDYALAATKLSSRTIENKTSAAIAQMDATRMALLPGTFDTVLMLDFVEHLYQPELETAFLEARKVLKPGGRLIIHTSPNRIFEEVVYRHYVRNVHRALLGASRLLRVQGRILNPLMLPTDPLPPHSEFERQLHVNPQSSGMLRSALQRQGFMVRRVNHWEPPHGSFFKPELRWHNAFMRLLDFVRFLRPFSRIPPLNRLFSNHIWVVAERR